jgi:hypothetical protein
MTTVLAEAAVDEFDKILDSMNVVPAIPELLTYGEEKYAVVCQHAMTCQERRKVYNCALARVGCQSCSRQARQLVGLSTSKGPIFEFFEFDGSCPHIVKLCEMATTVSESPVETLKIMTGETVAGLNKVTTSRTDYHHFHRVLDADTMKETNPTPDASTISLLEKAFRLYLPEMFPRLIQDLTAGGGVTGAIESLKLVMECMTESTYGDTAQWSVQWMLRVMEHIQAMGTYSRMTNKERFLLHAQFLLWTKIHPSGDHSVVSPLFQQASNNIMSILQEAKSKAAAKAMLSDRFSPKTYKRPQQKELSAAVVRASAAKLGAFTNEVMTVEEVRTLPNTVTLTTSTPEERMYADLMPKPKKVVDDSAGGFAKRCGGALASKISAIKTVDDLVEYARKHPASTVMVQASTLSEAFIVRTDLNEDVRNVPHFWGYHTTTCKPKMANVTDIVPIYEYIPEFANCVFVLKDTPIKPTGNVCFPAFLRVKYERELREVFEALNRTSTLKWMAPGPSGQYATGGGLTAANKEGKLKNPLVATVDGVRLELRSVMTTCSSCHRLLKQTDALPGSNTHITCTA